MTAPEPLQECLGGAGEAPAKMLAAIVRCRPQLPAATFNRRGPR
jgi:hypothetical protein